MAAPQTKAAAAPEYYAFEFKLLAEKIGATTTNPQVKSKVADAFLGYGAFTETQIVGSVGADRTVVVFFARLFEKGLPTYEKLKKGETVQITIYDEAVDVTLSESKPSGGGATTGTSGRPKKEAPKTAGRGRGRGDKPKGETKEGEKKDGVATPAGAAPAGGRGRGRGEKKDEKKESLQRGRANIGGKLGPISKVRLAKQAKEARDKENAERAAQGLPPLEEPKKKGRHGDDDDDLPPKKDDKKAAGKKDAGKAAAKAPAKKK